MADDPNSFYVFGTKVQKGKRPVHAAGTLTSPYNPKPPEEDKLSGKASDLDWTNARESSKHRTTPNAKLRVYPSRVDTSNAPPIPVPKPASKPSQMDTMKQNLKQKASSVPIPRMKPTDNGPTFKHQNSYLKSLGQNSPSKGNSFRRYDEKK